MPAQEHINTPDLAQELDNLYTFDSRLRSELNKNNIAVISNRIIFADWDERINNCQAVIINYDDIIWSDSWFGNLVETAKRYNLKFTLITNVVYTREEECEWYKVMFLKELYGVFYNPAIKQERITYANLYTCLLQRTTYPRLKLFSELARNNLLPSGNVSLLGYQTNIPSCDANEVVESINDEFNEFDDIISNFKFPFKNFTDDGNCFDIEQQSKYIIVSETFNDDVNPSWVSFTEKTFRGLQIPNISLLLNKKDAVDELINMGFKIHPINHILSHLTSFNSQSNFIVGLLKNDMFDEVGCSESTHNQNRLMEWYNILQTDDFYDEILLKLHK